jgi:hypothetical protein
MRRVEAYARIIGKTNVRILQTLHVHSQPSPYLQIIGVTSEWSEDFPDENAQENMFP